MRILSAIALVLVAMLLTHTLVYTPVVEGGVVAIAIAAILGAAVGGFIGYHLGRQQSESAVVFEMYRNQSITVTAYVNQMSSLMIREYNAYLNNSIALNASYFNHLATYYRQWADYIACTSCTQGTMPSANETLTPIAEDLANMVRSEIQGIMDMLHSYIRTAVGLIETLKTAGVSRTSGSLSIVRYGSVTSGTFSYYRVDITPVFWVGEVVDNPGITLMLCMGGVCTAQPFDIILSNIAVGVWYWWNSTYILNETAIIEYVRRETPGPLTLRVQSLASSASTSIGLGFIDAAPRLYRIARTHYQVYCTAVQNLPSTQVCYPPPSVVIPVDEVSRLPPDVQIQIYMGYLNRLATANWTQVREVTPETVYIAVGASRIYGVMNNTPVEVTPVTVPFALRVKVGSPLPLIGTWIINGTLRTITATTVTSDMTSQRVSSDLPYYYVYAANGTLLGIGVDLDNNGSPDVYTPQYLSIVTRILDYDTDSLRYIEKQETQVGMTAKEYKPLQTISEYPTSIPLPQLVRFQWRIDRTTILIVVAAAIIIILIAVAARGGSRDR